MAIITKPIITDETGLAIVEAIKNINSSNGSTGVIGVGAGYHNSIYRGINLGNTVTDAQWASISAGTFDDLFIGDYWVIDGVNYRIAAFDYYYGTGDIICNTHHVTLVPDTVLYTHKMNSSNTVDGAYVSSLMYTSGLDSAKTTINTAFGEDHVLNHRQYLINAVSGGTEIAGAWYDSTVELMTSQNVFGSRDYSNNEHRFTIDGTRYPLFTFSPDIITIINNGSEIQYWLREVSSNNSFHVVVNVNIGNAVVTTNHGVRPAFSIC